MYENCGPYWAKVNDLKDETSVLIDRIEDLKSIPSSPSLEDQIAKLESKKERLNTELIETKDEATRCEQRKSIDDRYKDNESESEKDNYPLKNSLLTLNFNNFSYYSRLVSVPYNCYLEITTPLSKNFGRQLR